jgi:hypothetical protein
MLESASIFKRDRIGGQLIVHTWLCERLGGSHVLIEHVPEMLSYFGDDARPSGRSVRDVDGAVGEFDDGGGDGGERAFEGLDEVGFCGDVAECVCGVGDAEVCCNVSFKIRKSCQIGFANHSSHCSL